MISELYSKLKEDPTIVFPDAVSHSSDLLFVIVCKLLLCPPFVGSESESAELDFDALLNWPFIECHMTSDGHSLALNIFNVILFRKLFELTDSATILAAET